MQFMKGKIMLKKSFAAALATLALTGQASPQTITTSHGGTVSLDKKTSELVFQPPSKNVEKRVPCKDASAYIISNLEEMTAGMNDLMTPEYAPVANHKDFVKFLFEENKSLRDDLFQVAQLCPAKLYPGAQKTELDQADAKFEATYDKAKATLIP